MAVSPELVASDLPELVALSAEAREAAKAANVLVTGLAEDIYDGQYLHAGDAGNSLLKVKNLLLLEYLTNLAYVYLKKTSGSKVAGDAAVERLVEVRTVLEKLRPLEQKLRYQLDKAVKAAEEGVSQDDPLRFRANPDQLMSKLNEDGDSDGEGDEGEGDDVMASQASGKYVAPKHVPAFFDEGDGEGNPTNEVAKSKKQVLSKSMIEDLKRQHLDTPEEIFEQEDVLRKRQLQALKERERYEEDNFMRLPLTKKAKRGSRRQMSTMGDIANEVTSFGRSYFSERAGVGKVKRKTGSKKGFGRKRFKK